MKDNNISYRKCHENVKNINILEIKKVYFSFGDDQVINSVCRKKSLTQLKKLKMVQQKFTFSQT